MEGRKGGREEDLIPKNVPSIILKLLRPFLSLPN
jgi:hypothetical protein